MIFTGVRHRGVWFTTRCRLLETTLDFSKPVRRSVMLRLLLPDEKMTPRKLIWAEVYIKAKGQRQPGLSSDEKGYFWVELQMFPKRSKKYGWEQLLREGW